jgi:hypothetical protein
MSVEHSAEVLAPVQPAEREKEAWFGTITREDRSRLDLREWTKVLPDPFRIILIRWDAMP